MADEYGLELVIPDGFIKKLQQADDELEYTAMQAEETKERVIKAFKDMGDQGVDYFLKKLEAMNSRLSELSTKSITLKGLETSTKGAAKAADDVVRVADAFGQVVGVTPQVDKGMSEINSRLSQMWDRLRQVRTDIDMYYRAIGSGRKEEVEFGQSGLKEANKEAERLMKTIESLTKVKEGLNEKKSVTSFIDDEIDRINKSVEAQTAKNSVLGEQLQMEQQSAEFAQYQAAEAQKEQDMLEQQASLRIKQMQFEAAEREKQEKQYSDALNKEFKEKEQYERMVAAEEKKAADARQKEQERIAKDREKQAKADERNAKDYIKWWEKAIDTQERLNETKKEGERKTYQGALSYSSNAKNMMEDVQAIKYLEAARSKLNRTDSDYAQKLATLNNAILQHKKNIADAKGETLNLENQQRSLINTGDQLRRKLGLIFSVSAITGYIKKMVEVRGEFELQKVALTAILQNKEKADELWARTQELALQSPFRLSQLVTFTKQLAAYQVEADKLYETNKRLADVSAGLGVDMGRLILAFGQVKAANYLRSAEIRQFTEAGINMLGELSKLYTELEGKMVSVGEVQERVQKRMVSFGDVEEVFKRLTDAGGMFYNMQEKQSETLKGMIAKLGDALDIMLNKIGEANEGVLKGAVQATLNLLQNWQKIGDVVLPILGAIIARMMILKAPDLFKALILQLGVLTDSLKLAFYQAKRNKQAFDALSASAKAASTAFKGWAAIIAIVVAAAWGLVRVYQAAKKEQDAINKIAADAGNNARILAAKYESLVKIVQDQTSSYQEQKSAIEELKRTYGDILPSELLEIENIRTMGKEYDKAREAIYSYIEAKAKQKQIDVIEANEGEKLRSIESNIIDGLTKGLRDVLGKENVQRAEISAIITDVLQKQREGIIDNASQAMYYIRKAIKEAYEIEFESSEEAIQALSKYFRETGHNFSQDIQMLILRGKQYNDAIEETMTKSVSTLKAGLRKLEDARKKWESADENAKIRKAFESTQNWQFLTDKQKQNIIKDLGAFYEKMKEAMPDWSEVVNDPLRFDEETRRFNQMWLKSMVKDLDDQFTQVERNAQGSEQVLQATWDKFTQDVQKKIDTQNLERWQNAVKGGIIDFAKAHEYSLDGMQAIVLKAGQTTDDYFKGIEEQVNTLKQEIDWEESKKQNLPAYAWTAEDETALERMREMLAIYQYIMSLYPVAKQADKEGDKADREALNLLKERVKLIQEANKEYEKNLQYFTQEEAVAKTLNSYKNAFKQAGISNLLDERFLTDEGVLEALSKLPINVGGKLRDEALQYMADTTAKVSVELDIDQSQTRLKTLKEQVQELFDGIDIFQDLVKIGFTEEEVRRIFNIEITNTEQLRRRLEEMKDEFVGTKGIDDYNAFMRKIDEIEDKQNVERLKRYEKYLKTMMRETAEIRIQALQDIQDVMKMSGRSSDEKTSIIEGISKEAQKKLQEQQWKQFQESDDYQLLFSDIEHLSVSTATRLKDVLDNLRTSLNELTPHQLRQIQAQYEKLDEQIIKHNPFEAVRESMKAIKNLASEEDLNNYMTSLTEERFDAQSNLDALDILINAKEKGLRIDKLDEETRRRINGLEYESIDALMQIRKGQEDYIDSILAEQGWTEEQINKYKRLRKAMDAANDTWKGVMSSTKQTLSDIKGAYEAMNDGAQSITLEMVDAGITLADASYQMVELLRNFKEFKKEAPGLGAALNTSLGIIGLIATAVQTIINVINMIASAHDESLEEDIKDYENRVNRLADAYDRLAEKIQKAYSFAMLATSTNQGLTNLQEQVVAYERMIEAERDKKDSDSERIQEWTDKVEELRAKMEETKKSAVQEAGGLGGEYKDAAQGFVDAWMQAFRETGNGLDALNEHFEDFLWEIAGKQLLLRAADRFFTPLFEEFDKRMTADTTAYDRAEKEMLNKIDKNKQVLEYVANMPYEMAKELRDSGERTFGDFGKYFDDIENDERRLKDIQAQRQNAIQNALTLDEEDFDWMRGWGETNIPLISDTLKKIAGSLGFKGGEGGDTLSGLQKGIQGITESTAEIIEAYLNSMRFFVSDSNQKLTELLERFASADDTRSPILAELRAQTSYLNSIDRALSTIIDPSGWRNGGGVLKVMM